MKFKYYLRGCGIGILFTAIILMISFRSDKNQMTDSQVMERVSELGMITPEKTVPETENTQVSEPANTDEITKNSEADKMKDGGSVPETEEENTEELEVVPDFDTEDNKKEESKKEDKASDSNSKKTQKYEKIVLEIKRGDVCRTISENLVALGMVEDAEEFRKYMQKNGYDHQINVGSFELKKGMSYEEIAKMITS